MPPTTMRSLLATASALGAISTKFPYSLFAAAAASSSSSVAFPNASSSSLSTTESSTPEKMVQHTNESTCRYGYPLYRLRVLLIRHGESENNVLYGISPDHYRKNRRADPALTDRGRKQAEECGKYLSAHPSSFSDFNPILGDVESIFVSPMIRTLETARPIADALGLRPEVWTDIYELSGLHVDGVGQPGLTKSDMRSRFPDYVVPDDVTDDGWYPADRDRESRAMAIPRILGVADRLADMARECRRNRRSRTVALVAHGDFKDMILQALLGLEIPVEKRKRFLSYNTAISVVDVDAAPIDGEEEEEDGGGEDGGEGDAQGRTHATVLLQNFVGHLDSSLITHEKLGII